MVNVNAILFTIIDISRRYFFNQTLTFFNPTKIRDLQRIGINVLIWKNIYYLRLVLALHTGLKSEKLSHPFDMPNELWLKDITKF